MLNCPDSNQSAVSDAGTPTGKHRIPLHRLGLITALVITAAVYINTVLFEFVYDDIGQIVYNPRIKSGQYIWLHFTSHVWAQTSDVALYYRPLFMLWLMANYALFALHPLWWHLTAIALHLISCLLLYFFVCRLTGSAWVAVVAVLLFGVHPAHLESVAWISGATESLLAVLLLGTLLCYLRSRDSGKAKPNGWMGASLLLAFLAVMAKETALITPALIFCYEWIFRDRDRPRKTQLWSAARAAAPYALISFSFLVFRALALKSLTPPRTKAPLSSILLAWPKVLAFYCAHVIFPLRMSVFYNFVLVEHPGLRNFAAPLIVTVMAVGFLYYASRRSRPIAFLSAWLVITVIPLLNVTLWDNVENVHDRYLYLPSIAFCVILAILLSRLREMRSAKIALVSLTAIALAYAYDTLHESRYWANDYALAQHGLVVSPGHPVATQLLGNAMMRQGKMAEAIPYLVDALQLKPDNSETLWCLGLCYYTINNLPLAEEYARRSIALQGSDPKAHLLLGNIRFKQNRLDDAEAAIQLAIKLQRMPKGYVLYHYYLGNVLYAKGDLQGALREFQLELLNDPDIDPAIGNAQKYIDDIERRLHQTQ